jgi:hypothetical protein
MRTGTTYEQDEFDGPTPERMRIANGELRSWASQSDSGRRITRFEIASPVTRMLDKGQITVKEHRAAEDFYRDYVSGMRIAGLTSKYGERMGFGGTPLNQQSRSVDSPEDRRLKAHMKYMDACRHVGHAKTVYWLEAIICAAPIGDSATPPTLEDVGRDYGGYECRKRAQAAGSTLIKSGLERLAAFYGHDE